MDDATIDAHYRQIGQLVNQRKFMAAFGEAEILVYDPDARRRARTYFYYNLAVCLSGQRGGARGAGNLVIWAQSCSDYTPEIGGDMKRDQVIALVRYGRSSDLLLAGELLRHVYDLHAFDPNRLLCASGVEGRLHYARRDYTSASSSHALADEGWQHMNHERNECWRYNNLVHWLKAVVKLEGRHSPTALRIRSRINSQAPAGMKNRRGEAQIICLPLIGNPVDDLCRRWR